MKRENIDNPVSLDEIVLISTINATKARINPIP